MGISSATYDCLDISEQEGMLDVVIDNPDSRLNLIDQRFHHELAQFFNDLKRESDLRSVVLRTEGKPFTAGGSYEWFRTIRTPEALATLGRDARQMIWDLLDVEVPIVVAVSRYALGLGASIALLSDIVFMSKDAVIADPHVSAGLVAGDGGVIAWPLTIGPLKAKQFLLTGDPMSADEALRLGLANFIVSEDELGTSARAFARRLAEQPPLAVRYTKLAINQLIKHQLSTAFDVSTAYELTTFMSSDHAEAVDAFLEKRPARRFLGR